MVVFFHTGLVICTSKPLFSSVMSEALSSSIHSFSLSDCFNLDSLDLLSLFLYFSNSLALLTLIPFCLFSTFFTYWFCQKLWFPFWPFLFLLYHFFRFPS